MGADGTVRCSNRVIKLLKQTTRPDGGVREEEEEEEENSALTGQRR